MTRNGYLIAFTRSILVSYFVFVPFLELFLGLDLIIYSISVFYSNILDALLVLVLNIKWFRFRDRLNCLLHVGGLSTCSSKKKAITLIAIVLLL